MFNINNIDSIDSTVYIKSTQIYHTFITLLEQEREDTKLKPGGV
jgi:hypothetical protein